MTEQRASEIERLVFYRYVDNIKRELSRAGDCEVAFDIGAEMGYIHRTLREELDKEIDDKEQSE